MKKLAIFILLFSIGSAYAQQPDYYGNQPKQHSSGSAANYDNGNGTNDDFESQVRIIDSIQEIRADILPFKTAPKIKNDRYYYWYFNKVIHSIQGGYNGNLLNGHYVAFYPDKNLKEEGEFKRGLKDGEWKTWNPKGDLTGVTYWSDGVESAQTPIWKKIPFLNKKEDQPKTTESN